MSAHDVHDGTSYTSTGEPQTLAAKVMVALTGWMFRKATAKACAQDLDDIAAAAQASEG